MPESSTTLDIMYSYLILAGFLIVMFGLTGQSLFGGAFPDNPFTQSQFGVTGLTCAEGDYGCTAIALFNNAISIVSVPFLALNYVFQMFIFFMTSPTLWWMGTIIFVPAGVIFMYLFIPLIIDLLGFLARLLHAIAEAIPF